VTVPLLVGVWLVLGVGELQPLGVGVPLLSAVTLAVLLRLTVEVCEEVSDVVAVAVPVIEGVDEGDDVGECVAVRVELTEEPLDELAVGVFVTLGVAVSLCVIVGVWDDVSVCEGDAVMLDDALLLGVSLAEAPRDKRAVGELLTVELGVADAVCVELAEGVAVGVWVTVAAALFDDVGDGDGVSGELGDFDALAPAVSEAVGLRDVDGLAESEVDVDGVGDDVGEGVATGVSAADDEGVRVDDCVSGALAVIEALAPRVREDVGDALDVLDNDNVDDDVCVGDCEGEFVREGVGVPETESVGVVESVVGALGEFEALAPLERLLLGVKLAESDQLIVDVALREPVGVPVCVELGVDVSLPDSVLVALGDSLLLGVSEGERPRETEPVGDKDAFNDDVAEDDGEGDGV
jgi:hypothetical protein